MCTSHISIVEAVDLAIKGLAVVVAATGAVYAIKEYRNKRNWAKNEFLAKEIKDFFNDFNVKRALWMLDWNHFNIPLKKEELNNKSFLKFDNELFKSSLTYHLDQNNGSVPSNHYTAKQILIRVIFDEFFQKLGAFQTHIDNKLFSHDDLDHYFRYYLAIIGDKTNKQKSEDVKRQILYYIKSYQYVQVERLIRAYNFPGFDCLLT